MCCSRFRYVHLEIPHVEFEMSITGLDPLDTLSRLEKATGALARVERPGVPQLSRALEKIRHGSISASNRPKPEEIPDDSQHDSPESLIERLDGLDLAEKALHLQPITPQEALNTLYMTKRAIQDKLRQNYLRRARRGMPKGFGTQSRHERVISIFLTST